MEMHHCDECNFAHHDGSWCKHCEACLYMNSRQVLDKPIDYQYPFFRCTNCGQINFWD